MELFCHRAYNSGKFMPTGMLSSVRYYKLSLFITLYCFIFYYLHYFFVISVSWSFIIKQCDLRAKLMVGCLVSPVLWVNLSDSSNILIIHFGLLLKEHTLDSIGHDLWKKI